MGRAKKQRFIFKGDVNDDSLLIGSHGDAMLQVEGVFSLSGIIYCPKFDVTVTIMGEGRVTLRGKCSTLIVKRIKGNCTLDITELTCRELRCECMQGQATVLTGKTRLISRAILADEAELHVARQPLITSSFVSGSSRIVQRAGGEVLE